MNKKAKSWLALVSCLLALFLLGTANAAAPDYGDQNNWAYYGSAPGPIQAVDVFFVGPTTFPGTAAQRNMPLDAPELRRSFLGASTWKKEFMMPGRI